ncbi:glycerophosphodiester phosphodiesterase [Nocardioides nitrophenolicus]|uniref:glycerophosphodiester phosphodiesterase n=1 Tax=Nocardioides nitrophenolicus TaxID=60489 RepID=UPI00195D63CF|nr:glycerophosphodiester phosphodiesterase [Nocardioides nitrophenolicus]MBM7515984.1 glycerophosphoryl diester phosphodiesterase [Nocardioides nitrophenolicus]
MATTAAVVALGAAAVPAQAAPGHGAGRPDRHPGAEPIVIAHRGASGYRPEHTLAAYRLAIRMGADYVEPDLVSTKDGVLVARHENEISGTTDVATHPEFADRRTTKTIDGVAITGWFTEDFTLAELKTLRAKERLPQVRPDNTRYDGQFEIPTLDEVIRLVKRESGRTGRTIGIAPETKHPTYFGSIGLGLEEPLVRTLRRNGLDRPNAKVVIQSFEDGNLRRLAGMTRVPLAQLVERAEQVTPARLADIATYADWVAPTKNLVIPRDPAGAIGAPSSLVADAHAVGLRVVTWTMRVENQFLPTNHRIGTDPNAKGDLAGEIDAFLDAGVDALFSDNPDLAVATRDSWLAGEGAA